MRNTFIVFGSPVAKQRPRTFENDNGKSVTITPRKTRDYETDVQYEAKKARVRVPGLVVVRLRCLGTRGDVDNVLKSVLDGMNNVVYDDDRQVEELHVYLQRDVQVPRAEVTVGPKGVVFGDEVRAAAEVIEQWIADGANTTDARGLAIAALTAARAAGAGEAA